MAQKRKMEMSSSIFSDANQRVLFSTFHNTASVLSDFYNQSVNHHKIAFDAGQKYSLLKMQDWMGTKLQEGKMVTVQEIFAYLQDKLRSEGVLPEQQSAQITYNNNNNQEEDDDTQMEIMS